MKRINKKIKIFISAVVGMALILGFVSRVIYVNGQYPKVTSSVYSMGESFEWHDFTICVTGYETMTAQQVQERWYGFDITGMEDTEIIVASMDVAYNGEEESDRFPIINIKGQSGAWHNASNYHLLTELNKNGANIERGETKTLYTAIEVSPFQFSADGWEKHKERDIQLVFQIYPDFVAVQL